MSLRTTLGTALIGLSTLGTVSPVKANNEQTVAANQNHKVSNEFTSTSPDFVNIGGGVVLGFGGSALLFIFLSDLLERSNKRKQ
ncbi:MAG: hypothetical protein HY094_04810 [Candidatus Melainabacteria bacterium]|nr:hypothetical protein [Candidatus Melainabacteria bacterium]